MLYRFYMWKFFIDAFWGPKLGPHVQLWFNSTVLMQWYVCLYLCFLKQQSWNIVKQRSATQNVIHKLMFQECRQHYCKLFNLCVVLALPLVMAVNLTSESLYMFRMKAMTVSDFQFMSSSFKWQWIFTVLAAVSLHLWFVACIF